MVGGDSFIKGGDGSNGRGGVVVIEGGHGSDGGGVFLRGGVSSASSSPSAGVVNIEAGSIGQASAVRDVASVTIKGGSSIHDGDFGDVLIQSGSSAVGSSGGVLLKSSSGVASGNLVLQSGSATNSQSGSILIHTGGSSSNVGSIEVKGGDGLQQAGSLSMYGGHGLHGGAVLIQGGVSEDGSNRGVAELTGENVKIGSFGGNSAVSYGGSVSIASGSVSNGGSGDIVIMSGASASGSAGSLIVEGGKSLGGEGAGVRIAAGDSMLSKESQSQMKG
eukprot:scaffold14343_cov288-Ochromonas_danica.AAC.1